MEYDVVIGLEIHAELKTKTKVFCSCKNSFGDTPNTNCCPVCVGFLGALPMINKHAVELTVKAGCAFGCAINEVAVFERKNYFYPDLSKAYQISQLVAPICVGGEVKLENKTIRLNRIHLEEDAGKLIHKSETIGTYIDYNRGGVPLIEIVTEPDIANATEAVEFLTKLRKNLIFADIANCKMEQGGMRCDVNLSIKPKGSKILGTRTEMKNLNSFKMVERAINYESKRQIEVLESGGVIKQETRKWDDNRGKSFAMRSKERAQDYRYFKDPDIPPIKIERSYIEEVKKSMPPLADELVERYQNLGLSKYDATLLTTEVEYTKYFESLLTKKISPRLASNIICGELFKILKETDSVCLDDIILANDLAKILAKTESKQITLDKAKEIINACKYGGGDVETMLKSTRSIITDKTVLTQIAEQILAQNISAQADYAGNKQKVLNFFTGLAMKQTKGQADAVLLKEIFIQKLEK